MIRAIVCHPDSVADLVRDAVVIQSGGRLETIGGTPVYVSKHVPRYACRWEGPDWPFVEFDRHEIIDPNHWVRKLGLCRYVETDEAAYFLIGGHSSVYDQVQNIATRDRDQKHESSLLGAMPTLQMPMSAFVRPF